jgi:hypothetical protein
VVVSHRTLSNGYDLSKLKTLHPLHLVSAYNINDIHFSFTY